MTLNRNQQEAPEDSAALGGEHMTQGEMIIEYLERFGSITPFEAFRDLGITKLATRISEMRKAGMEFNKEYVTSKNRFGNPVTYMKYSLKE